MKAGAVRANDRIDFLVVGVQKAGTTTLDYLLRAHPGFAMGSKKEIHFFDQSPTDWAHPDYAPYHAFFADWDATRLRGEITPVYISMPGCLERIRAYNPRIKLVASFRNPIDRAYSQWRMERARRIETLPFSEAIREPGRRRAREAPGGWHPVFSYVERGFYGAQVAHLLSLFPAEQFLALDFDELTRDQAAAFAKVCAFLGARRPETPVRDVQVVVAAPDGKGAAEQDSEGLADADRGYLAELYADDVAKFRRLTGLPLAQWSDWPA